MSTRYAIVATLQRVNDKGWETHAFLPTFYLDSDVQGIVSADHAGRIALDLFPAEWMVPSTRVTLAVSSETETAVVWRNEGDYPNHGPNPTDPGGRVTYNPPIHAEARRQLRDR